MDSRDKKAITEIGNVEKRLRERALGINEMKPEVKTRFLEISKNDFGNHHGVALEWLIKCYDGYFPTGHEEIEAKIDILAENISELKKELTELKKEENKPEGILMADGSTRR